MQKILKLKDVCKILGIGRCTALELFHREGFPSFKLGNKWMVHADKFDQWLKEQ